MPKKGLREMWPWKVEEINFLLISEKIDQKLDHELKMKLNAEFGSESPGLFVIGKLLKKTERMMRYYEHF